MKDKAELKGIGGWLILVAIGVTLGPFIAVGMDYAIYSEVFSEEVWSTLTDSNNIATYTPNYSLAVSVELVASIIIDAYLFRLMFLFYTKKLDFPSLYIKLVYVIFAFIILDIIMVSLVFPNSTAKDLFDPFTIRAIFQSIFSILVWVPYMKKSVRVKNTFIN